MSSPYYNDGTTSTDFQGALPLIPDQYNPTGLADPNYTNFLNTLGSNLSVNGVPLTTQQVQWVFIAFLGSHNNIYGNAQNASALAVQWEAFTEDFSTGPVITPNDPALLTGDPSLSFDTPSTNPFIQAFQNLYLTSIGATTDSGGQLSGDWSILTTNPDDSTYGPLANFGNLFQNFLQSNFISGFLDAIGSANLIDNVSDETFYNPGDRINRLISIPTQNPQVVNNLPPAETTVLNAFESFLTTTATMQSSSDLSAPFTGLASYQQIYNAFGPPGATEADFVARLKQFYTQQVAQNGFFLPSQDFSQWITEIRSENNSLQAPGTYQGLQASNNYAITGSSLDGNNSDQVLIMNRIFALLVTMIQTLQQVGIAQANHLTYTTQYQQAYTALQEQIPTFVQGQNNALGGSDTNSSNARNEINSSVNAPLTDNLRSLRTLQENSAKQQQSNINTTNDGVNQQSDLATSFLQELNTLLTKIFS